MSFQTPITIASALERIHCREYVLPAIQREFVWSRDKITRLFDSASAATTTVPEDEPDAGNEGL
jgi:uncharacterized protein with ParB-like and HNH nuclease domain